MGTYTYIRDSNIEVTDKAGLANWIEENLPVSSPVFKGVFKGVLGDDKSDQSSKSCKDDYEFWKERLKASFDGEDIEVYDMIQETKLAGYWYRSEGLFFRDLAMFVEGFITIIDENNEGLTRLTFRDGECFVEPGQLKEEFDGERPIEKWVDMPKLDKKTKMMRKL